MATTTRNKRPTNPKELKTLAVMEKYVLGTARFMEIPTKDLHVDMKYQRDLNDAAIKRMVGDFKHDLFEPPTVNDRSAWNGHKGFRFALLDGQHRKIVAQKLKMPTITCRIVTVPPDEEAMLFVELNRQRIYLSPVAAFKGELAAGNPAAKEIAMCVGERGLRVASPNYKDSDKPDTIACVAAMKRIYAQGGYVGLARTLDTARLAWPEDDGQRFSGQILLALSTFFKKNSKVNAGRLQEKLANLTARHLLAKGTTRWHAWQSLGEKSGSVVDAIADEIGKAYRKR